MPMHTDSCEQNYNKSYAGWYNSSGSPDYLGTGKRSPYACIQRVYRLHCIALHYSTLRYFTSTLCYVTLSYLTLHSLHYLTLPDLTLHYITLR